MSAPPARAPEAAVRARLAERAGDLNQARKLYGDAIARAPRHVGLLVEAAVVEGRLGNFKSAERLLSKAAKLDPADADVNYNLAQIAREEGHLERAIRLFRRTLELDPAYADAAYGLGEALYSQGKGEEALPWLEKARSASPSDAEIMHVYALALDHAGDIPGAVQAYRDVLKVAPAHRNAKLNLSLLMAQSADPLEARELIDEMEAANAVDPEHFAHVAKVLNLAGDSDRAFAYAQRAIEAGRDELEVANTQANIFIDFGDFDGAEQALRKVLKLRRDSIHSYYRLAVIKRLEPEAEPVLRRAARDGLISAVDRANAFFALYHLLDRAGKHDEAFQMLNEGNALKGGRVPFDLRRHEEQADRVIAAYTPELIAAHRQHGYDAKGAIFVGGMPRSGTTLTEQILAAHPQVHGGGESLDVARVVKRTPAWPVGVRDIAPDMLREQGRDIHEKMFRNAAGKSFATDKTPANFTFYGALACMLPNARLVYVRRQPGDNAMSLYEQNFLRGLGYSYDLANIGAVYRAHRKVMRHWIEACGLPIHTVEYDSLVNDPEPHIRALMEFAGPGFSLQCLTPDRVERPIRTSSVWQVRQPINPKSVGRWRRYEEQLAPFFRALEGVEI